MRKLLIVDDEKNIRVGLKAMIEREFPNRYVIAQAVNGMDALKMLSGQDIDLIITDIRMPVMDGITLINQLQKDENKPEIMILSGYDDFHYAKEAIRCDVRMYLLKPIVRDELFDALNRLEGELVKKEQLSQQFETYSRQKKEHIEVQLNYLFLQSSIGKMEVGQRMTKLDLPFLREGYQIMLLRSPDTDIESYDQKPSMSFIDSVLNQMGDSAAGATLRFYNKNHELVVITGAKELLPGVNEIIQERSGPNLKIGASSWTTALSEMKESYLQAEKALKYTLFHAYPACIAYETIGSRQQGYALPLQSIQKITNMLGTDRHAEMKQLFNEVLDFGTVVQYDIAYLEGISQAFNEKVFDHVFNVYGEESVEILKLYKRVADLYSFPDFQNYSRHVKSLIDKLNEYVGTMKTVHNDYRDMKKAIQYIQDNYNKDLNMAMVSNHVSLNYSYFSQAFKDYTKESFVNHLKKIRISKAKELLTGTELKVHEIGEKIGFENAKHFHRVFRELEGISPNEYRQKERLSIS